MTGRTFGNAQASLALRSLILPVLLRLADVGFVAQLGHLLGLGERLRVGDLRSGMEFLGLVGISLLHGEVADFAQQERAEQREQSQACLSYAES